MQSHLFSHLHQVMSNSGHNYDTYQIVTLTVGMIVWAYLYIYLAYRGIKTKFVQMPLILACANVVWEFLWGFIFQSEHETGVMIGVIPAFITDCVIFYGILKYGPRYVKIPFFAKNLKPLAALGIACFLVIWWTFKASGMDTDGGGASGNLLNAIIVVWWIDMIFKIKDFNLLSVRLGWAKLIADIPIALFMMSVFPDRPFAWCITWISVLFDIIYIWLFYERKNGRGIFKNYSPPN